MTDLLRIAHPQNCPPYGNSRVGICEGNLLQRNAPICPKNAGHSTWAAEDGRGKISNNYSGSTQQLLVIT